jgi:hypothetical protein
MLGLLLASAPAQALIICGLGNTPVQDMNWRAGSVDVANLPSRVGWWEGPPFGGGAWTFLYRGDTDDFNQALEAFAKVRAPSLELIVSDGPAESPFLKEDRDPKTDVRYDWDFAIWDVQSYYRLYGNPASSFLSEDPNFHHPLPPPRLTVYVGGGGGVVWDTVRLPKGIVVIDKRAATAGIKPGQGALIAGSIYDLATSKPLPNASVAVQKPTVVKGVVEYETTASAQSDAQGRFRFEKVPSGTYRVSISASGYAALATSHNLLVADGYQLLDDVELAPQATVSGSVLDETGQPIAGADVRLADILAMNGQSYSCVAPAQAYTDSAGVFHISGVPVGFGRVICFARGYFAKAGEVQSIPAKDITIRAVQTGTIEGRVLGGAGPGGNINVSIEQKGERKAGNWGGAMQVKPDGTFQFDNVPPGTYVLSTRPLLPGVPTDPNAKTVEVVAGQTATVELTP